MWSFWAWLVNITVQNYCKKHNKYVKHTIIYLETIGVNQNLLLSAVFLFSVHELIHINDFWWFLIDFVKSSKN